MKILLLSDNHHKNIDLNLKKFDYVFHMGDYGYYKDFLIKNNIIFVKGNCDLEGENDKILEINNKKIYICHGDRYNVKSNFISLCLKAESIGADMVFYGHTHHQLYFNRSNINFINPGAYMDGYYAILDDNILYFYIDNKIAKKIILN